MSSQRTSAPAQLRRLQTFLNSTRRLYGQEDLAEPHGASRWLRENGYADGALALDVDALGDLVRFREAMREHLGGRAPGATAIVNEYARRTLRPPRWTRSGGVAVEPAADGGVDELIGRLLAVAFEAAADGSIRRLRPCRADDCRWVFYDRSPGGTSTWCAMDLCGARHKMRTYRSRRRGASPAAQGARTGEA